MGLFSNKPKSTNGAPRKGAQVCLIHGTSGRTCGKSCKAQNDVNGRKESERQAANEDYSPDPNTGWI